MNNYPKLHNATWPGVVGKGPDSEPPLSLDVMIDLTVQAEVDGTKFDGVDIFLCSPHVDVDSSVPLPPNRPSGFPRAGSPVGGFTSERIA